MIYLWIGPLVDFLASPYMHQIHHPQTDDHLLQAGALFA